MGIPKKRRLKRRPIHPSEVLRRGFQPNAMYGMPAHFGRIVPRALRDAVYAETATVSITYRTLPPEVR